MVSVYHLLHQMRHNGAREPIYRHDSVELELEATKENPEICDMKWGARKHRKLLDNFSHESDFTSLQDPFLTRP